MMVSCQLVVGGTLPASATNAVHASFDDVARIRAEPLPGAPPTVEFTPIPAAGRVANITVAPAATVSEVATASLSGGPPGDAKTSTPTCMVAVSVDVQPKKVSRPPPRTILGTE